MKNGVPVAFVIHMLGLLLVGPAPLAGQSLLEDRLQVLVEAMQNVAGGSVEEQDVAKAKSAAQDYLDALGKAAERDTYKFLVDDLKQYEDGPFVVAETSVARLLGEVRFQRTCVCDAMFICMWDEKVGDCAY